MENKTFQYLETTVICKNCGAEFAATVAIIFGRQFTISEYCRECSDKLLAQEQQTETAKEQMEIDAQRRCWRENCGIDQRYMREDFSTFKTRRPGNIADVCRKCAEYADNFPIQYDAWQQKNSKAYPSLLLFSVGIWGNGKTHLVSSIAHRILDRWNGENIANPVYLISEPEIYDRIQQTYSYSFQEKENKQSEQDIVDQLSRVRLLIIDDLGKTPRRDMDFVRRTLFNIINRRYKSFLPVVITTNKDVEGIKTYLGNSSDEAALDRIIEMTGGKFNQVTGNSYRRLQKNIERPIDE